MKNAAGTHYSDRSEPSQLEERNRLREEMIRVRDNTERAMEKARKIMAGYIDSNAA